VKKEGSGKEEGSKGERERGWEEGREEDTYSNSTEGEAVGCDPTKAEHEVKIGEDTLVILV
jgi:hypothetical protein